jgi:hypothetical protein
MPRQRLMLKASVEAIRIAEVYCKNGQITPVHIIIIVKVAFAGVEKNSGELDIIHMQKGCPYLLTAY